MPLQILYCQKKLLETPTKHFQHHTRAGRGRLSTLARTRQDKTTANSGPLVSQMHCYFLFLAPLLSSKAFHSPNAGGSVPITSAQTRMSNLPFAASSHTSKVDSILDLGKKTQVLAYFQKQQHLQTRWLSEALGSQNEDVCDPTSFKWIL
jgi:hypothetical protein